LQFFHNFFVDKEGFFEYDQEFQSFCFIFTSFDYRHRNDPKSLQSSSNKILSKAFFNILCITGPELINNNFKKVPFFGLISDLIQCNNPDNDFPQLFRNHLPVDESIQKIEFIRRSAILESLLFNTFTISNEFDFKSFFTLSGFSN
jgi:hypothetical protein